MSSQALNIEHIWTQYRTSLRRFLASRMANQADVDDVLQEVLLKSYQRLDSLNDVSKIKAWLFQIANNALIDFYRAQGRSEYKQNHDASLALDEQNIDDQSGISASLAHCLLPFIHALPDADAELLMAIDIHGKPQKVYAAEQGISYSTLKSRVQKSRQRLHDTYTACCEFSQDKFGKVIDYQQKSDSTPRAVCCTQKP